MNPTGIGGGGYAIAEPGSRWNGNGLGKSCSGQNPGRNLLLSGSLTLSGWCRLSKCLLGLRGGTSQLWGWELVGRVWLWGSLSVAESR